MALLSCLDRKLIRDLAHYRGQVIAIALVVACGVAQFLTNRVSYDAIRTTQDTYYGQSRFADVFASLKRAPVSITARIAEIPGVQTAEPRIVTEVTLDVPGLDEPARGRIISIPEETQPQLNRLYLRRGRYIAAGHEDEILASEAFAEANHLQPGAVLEAVFNGKWRRLQIVGIALSPEYVYEIQPGALFPDNRRFGVFWMSRDVLAAAFDMKGVFNDIVLRLDRNASQQNVIAAVDRLLEPYGGLGAYGRSDQVSNRFVTDEIAQNRVFGIVIATIFMGIAAFLVSTLVTRVVSMEREQIGALKAFGFSTRAVSLHYVKFSMAVILAGALVGVVVGIGYASVIAGAYQKFYRFPQFLFRVNPAAIFLVISVSLATGVIGALSAAFKAGRLKPAEAMRPEAPANFHAGVVERLGLRKLPLTARIVIRNLERRPFKALFSIAGIALGVALLLVGYVFRDALFYIVEVQFRHVQHDHATIVFNHPRTAAVSNDIAALPAVLRVEPFRLVPVRLRHQHHSRRIGLMGLRQNDGLRQLVANDLSTHPVPEKGLVLSSKLADVLQVKPGDNVSVEPLEGRRVPVTLAVSSLVDELLGMSAYLNIDELNAIMREDRTVSGSLLFVDASRSQELYSQLKRMPAVGSVVSKDAMIESFNLILAQNSMIGTVVMISFASIIAFAAVYNFGRIALSERGRELASLRVLGFTRTEVTRMLVGEQALIVAVAIPLGLLLGYQIALMLSRIYSWELFRMPVVLTRASYAICILSVALSAALSALIVRYRISRMNLVSVIKTRE